MTMKNAIRILLLCLALVLCLTPVLVACDTATVGENGGEENTVNNTETPDAGDAQQNPVSDKRLTRFPSIDQTMYVAMYQIGEPDTAKGTVACSFVLHKAEDNSIIDFVIFDLQINGTEIPEDRLNELTWKKDSCDIVAENENGTLQNFTLYFNK
jgi:hypothetical protein